MAIYVFRISDGTLVSYCPNDTDPVADPTTLLNNGLTATLGLPPLDATHQWNPVTKSVVVVALPHSLLSLQQFWQRFTPSERQAIENLVATGTQGVKNQVNAFLRYVASGNVDCNDAYIQISVQQLETAGVIAAGRAVQIVA